MSVLYYHGNSVMNNNSCFQSNNKGIQINTILGKSGNLVAEQEHFPIKNIDKSTDKIQMDCTSRRKHNQMHALVI